MKRTDDNINFFRSFRGQLILSVAIVLSITTSAYIAVFTIQQRAFVHAHLNALDIVFCKTISASASIWVVSHDLTDLQELINSVLVNPEIVYAILTNENGCILAHTDRSKIGKYIIDNNTSLSPRIIRNNQGFVDVTVPIMFSGEHVGWARIGLNHSLGETSINRIIQIGCIYVLATILIGTFIAMWLGHRITQNLYIIQTTMNKVAAGDSKARSTIKGQNEVAILAHEFNAMLESLAQQELEIKTTEFRFEKLFNLSGVPLCIMRIDGNKATFNKRFFQPFGYDSNEMLHLTDWLTKIYPNNEYREIQTEIWKNAIKKALENKNEIENIVSKIYCMNGEYRTVILSGVIVDKEIIVTYFDVTEIKKTENKLLQNLKFTETLLMSIPIPVFIKDTEGRYTNCNEAFTKTTGYTAEYIKGKTEYDLWPTDQAELFTKKDIEILENRQYLSFLANIIDKENNNRDAIYFKNLFNDENGNPVGIIGAFIDITERNKAEENLKKSQILLKSSLESPKDVIIFSIDKDYNYLYYNDYHKEVMLIGYGIELKEGMNMLECMASYDDRERSRANFEIAFKAENYTAIEEYGTLERNYFETRYSPIFNDRNEVMGATAFSSNITKRILDEKKLRETNTYLENIINSANALIVLFDKQFQITRFNPYIQSLTGFTEAEVIGKSIEIIFPPQNKTEALEILHKTLAGERLEGIELEILNKDNTNSTILWNTATIFEDDGITPIATIAQGQNISERKKAEEELRDSELRYSNLFKNIQTGIVVHGPDTEVLLSNPKASELLGLSAEQMKGKAAIDPEWNFINENNEVLAVEAYPIMRIVNEKKVIKNQVFGICQPNKNEVVWVIVNGFPFINEFGDITEIVISFNDITEQKMAEKTLKLSEENYRMFSENFAGGVSFFENNKVKYTSDGYLKILGYEKNEIENIDLETIFSFIHKDDVENIKETIEAAHKAQKKQMQYCFRLKNKQGNYIWVEDIVQMEYDNLGNRFRSIIYSRDITERKQAEEKIQKLNEELEQRVIERTMQLESVNKQLAIENAENTKRAVELDIINKELETFSYSVSHDLRSPLRHIIAFSDMLVKDAENKLSDDSNHYLSIIMDAGKKMGVLIDDLLNFSRTSRAELKKETIDMNQIIENAKKQMQYPTINRSIVWQIAKLPTVIGDYNLLLLVWVNLMDNALKYSQNRKESIIVIDFQEEKNETIFSIHDNGVGFDMKYANKLFGIFQRLHSSSEFEGTGIGLANIQRIVTKHGGRVWAIAEIDKGATFYFSIPK